MLLEVLTDLTTVTADDVVADVEDIVIGSASIRREIALWLEEAVITEAAAAWCWSYGQLVDTIDSLAGGSPSATASRNHRPNDYRMRSPEYRSKNATSPWRHNATRQCVGRSNATQTSGRGAVTRVNVDVRRSRTANAGSRQRLHWTTAQRVACLPASIHRRVWVAPSSAADMHSHRSFGDFRLRAHRCFTSFVFRPEPHISSQVNRRRPAAAHYCVPFVFLYVRWLYRYTTTDPLYYAQLHVRVGLCSANQIIVFFSLSLFVCVCACPRILFSAIDILEYEWIGVMMNATTD